MEIRNHLFLFGYKLRHKHINPRKLWYKFAFWQQRSQKSQSCFLVSLNPLDSELNSIKIYAAISLRTLFCNKRSADSNKFVCNLFMTAIMPELAGHRKARQSCVSFIYFFFSKWRELYSFLRDINFFAKTIFDKQCQNRNKNYSLHTGMNIF